MKVEAENLRAPFPYPGCKQPIAPIVWSALGNPANYVEPFAGSGAVLLARPGGAGRFETLNDLDSLVANFFRAMAASPEAVFRATLCPVSEVDLHARHAYLVEKRERLTERILGNPRYYDAEVAGWWAWGASVNLAGAWCDGRGPWRRSGGKLLKFGPPGINRSLPRLTSRPGAINFDAALWVTRLHQRLRRVRLTCGDWRRVLKPSVTTNIGLTAGVLDPPYISSESMYTHATQCAQLVAEWARENGDNPLLRLALCGHEGDYDMPRSWRKFIWDRPRRRAKQPRRECVWFSPHCLPVKRSLWQKSKRASKTVGA